MKLTVKDLHIWHIPCVVKALKEQSLAPLPSAEESAQAARFLHPVLHQRYVKTRWAMRDILGHYLDTASTDVQLRYANLGKPELIPGGHSLDIRFNMTHSGDSALLAITLGSEVGIDMEKLGQKRRPLRLAKRYFTISTVNELMSVSDKEQQSALLKLWTQYEAYKKAQGVGLRGGEGLLPLRIELQENQLQSLPSDTDEPSNWLVSQLYPKNGYVAAVVVEASDQELQIQHIDFKDYSFT